MVCNSLLSCFMKTQGVDLSVFIKTNDVCVFMRVMSRVLVCYEVRGCMLFIQVVRFRQTQTSLFLMSLYLVRI